MERLRQLKKKSFPMYNKLTLEKGFGSDGDSGVATRLKAHLPELLCAHRVALASY